MNRTAKVDFLKVDSAGLSSVIQIGDSTHIYALNRAIAVQRQHELFYSHEGNFNRFGIFSYALPIPSIDEPITIQSTALQPMIKVGSIDVIGISSTAILHIGNSKYIQGEARTLHIRQLETAEKNEETEIDQTAEVE